MKTKIYVGQLPFATTSEQLSEIFAACGTVESAKIITDRDSGRSKGFGFVEMSTEEETKAAIEKLNGQEVGGRNIVVTEARPKENDGRSSGGPRRDSRPGNGGGAGGGFNKRRF